MESIPKHADLLISGISVPEISLKYLLRQIFKMSSERGYT